MKESTRSSSSAREQEGEGERECGAQGATAKNGLTDKRQLCCAKQTHTHTLLSMALLVHFKTLWRKMTHGLRMAFKTMDKSRQVRQLLGTI